MGNIRYPISSQNVTINGEAGSIIDANSVILYAPIGSVDIAANRESLEYTDRTRNALTAMVNNMFIDLISRLAKHVESQPTRILASINADKYANVLPHNINRALVQKCNWNGQKLLQSVLFKTPIKMHEKVKSWRTQDYRNRSTDSTSVSLTLNTIFTVYSDDQYSPSSATRRIRTLQFESKTSNNDRYYAIPRSKLAHVEPILTSADYVDLDNIEPLKPTRTVKTITNGKTKKSIRINVCTIKHSELKSGRLSDETEPKPLSDGRYIYVPLDRYDWHGHCDWLDSFNDMLRAVHTLSTEDPSNIVIHGVKKHHLNKLDDNWIQLDAYLIELFKAWRQQDPGRALMLDKITSNYQSNLPTDDMISVYQYCDDEKLKLYAKVIHAARSNYMSKYGQTLDTTNDLINMYFVMFYINGQKRSTYIQDMQDYITKNYVLLNQIDYHKYSDNKDLIRADILEYINNKSNKLS